MKEKWSASRYYAFLLIILFLITSIPAYFSDGSLFLFGILGLGDLVALILLILLWTGKLS